MMPDRASVDRGSGQEIGAGYMHFLFSLKWHAIAIAEVLSILRVETFGGYTYHLVGLLVSLERAVSLRL